MINCEKALKSIPVEKYGVKWSVIANPKFIDPNNGEEYLGIYLMAVSNHQDS